MTTVLTDATALDDNALCDWLTHRLGTTVHAVERDAAPRHWSTMVRLRAHTANGTHPLLLKICAGTSGVFGPSELHYYTRDYAHTDRSTLPIVPCQDGAYQDAPRAYHLLLDDQAATHTNAFDRPATHADAIEIARAIARLHAVYWDATDLERISEPPPSADQIDRYLDHVTRGVEPLQTVLANDPILEPTNRILDTIGDELRDRITDPARQTLVHGDTNPGNILLPTDNSSTPVYLIDRQPFDWSLRVWIGASDIAWLTVLYWESETRRACEHDMLTAYVDTLRSLGQDIDHARLLDDYRLAIRQCVCAAVEWLGEPADIVPKRWIWEAQLRRSIEAIDDWQDTGG